MAGPVALQLPLHGRRILRMVVEADIQHLVVQEERSQPAIEGDLTRAGGHSDATGIVLPDAQRVWGDLDTLRGQQIHQVQQVGQRGQAFSHAPRRSGCYWSLRGQSRSEDSVRSFRGRPAFCCVALTAHCGSHNPGLRYAL